MNRSLLVTQFCSIIEDRTATCSYNRGAVKLKWVLVQTRGRLRRGRVVRRQKTGVYINSVWFLPRSAPVEISSLASAQVDTSPEEAESFSGAQDVVWYGFPRWTEASQDPQMNARPLFHPEVASPFFSLACSIHL